MRYKLVLFDFDGTLADSFPWFVELTNQLAGKHGFKRILPGEIDRLRMLDSRALMAHLGIPLWKLPAITSEMRHLVAARAQEIPLFDGIAELLAELARRGIGIGVVTSNAEANVRTILGARNVAHIRHFECGASMFGKKAKFRKVVKASGVAPGDVLCVGDEIRDADAAREAGLDFAAVGWGYTAPEVLARHSCAPPFRSAGELAVWLTQARTT